MIVHITPILQAHRLHVQLCWRQQMLPSCCTPSTWRAAPCCFWLMQEWATGTVEERESAACMEIKHASACQEAAGTAAHHIVQDINAERGGHEQALRLPQGSLRCHQACAQDGQEGVEREVQVLHVVALVGLEHPLQPLCAAHHHHAALQDPQMHLQRSSGPCISIFSSSLEKGSLETLPGLHAVKFANG